MDWVLDKVVDQSDCGASVGNTKITDLVFADDAVIFAESLEVLVMALKALHEEAKPLGLEVSWLKTKVQVFGDLLDEAVQCSDEAAERLRDTKGNTLERDGIKASRLCTHRDDVDHINTRHLNELTGLEKVFESVDSDSVHKSVLDVSTPVSSRLVLKAGCQVMLTKNLEVGRGLVNGARGVVTGFGYENKGNPVVRFMSGVTSEIKYDRWSVSVTGGYTATRRQLPLKLAWAFSIHKSQGMTLDCAEMSFSRVFEAGQVYVALSRARNLKGLRVLDFNPSCVRAHPDVLKFYHNLRRAQYEHS
ncbi:ATP-dependent DNA helicase PIF1 [Chionoecetes opilio]|uniref:ATP-dependent DNA helicase PIF1 n=1 Tax=Chionoecetes opilio TaxID=41210 RepID=A0A8J4XKX7_CHIOP|nr:ATP-dependent DNA helicase PIF1 [Chionoecetes opilio]